jgi:hypothetical protein
MKRALRLPWGFALYMTPERTALVDRRRLLRELEYFEWALVNRALLALPGSREGERIRQHRAHPTYNNLTADRVARAELKAGR